MLACDGTGLAFNSDWDYDCFVRGPNKYDVCLNLHLVRHHRKTQYLHQDELASYRVIAHYTQFDHLEHLQDEEININIRMVCIKLENGSYEYLATNLGSNGFPPNKLKSVYRMRWGIETSFRFLKVTLEAEHFHSRKKELVIQEVWSRMILYNFCMEITRAC